MGLEMSRPVREESAESDLLNAKHKLLHGMVDRLESKTDAEGLAQVKRDLTSVHNKMFGISSAAPVDTSDQSTLINLVVRHAAIHREMAVAQRQGNILAFLQLGLEHTRVMNQYEQLTNQSPRDRSSQSLGGMFGAANVHIIRLNPDVAPRSDSPSFGGRR